MSGAAPFRREFEPVRSECRRFPAPTDIYGRTAKGPRMAKSVDDRGRGARLARRDEGAYCLYVTEEQRSQPGCIDRESDRLSHSRALTGLQPRAARRRVRCRQLRADGLIQCAPEHDAIVGHWNDGCHNQKSVGRAGHDVVDQLADSRRGPNSTLPFDVVGTNHQQREGARARLLAVKGRAGMRGAPASEPVGCSGVSAAFPSHEE